MILYTLLTTALATIPLVSASGSRLASNSQLLSTQNVLTPSSQVFTATEIAENHSGSLNDFMRSQYEASRGEQVQFAHKDFPNHLVKIKETTGWCDPDVKSYAGYITTAQDHELFFYFFESRSDPKNDPVLMWINGGPGCSSALGLFMELGPCSIVDGSNINGTKVNPHSWNSNANLFFLEQPIGVSWSYGKHGQQTVNTEEAAVDVTSFVQIFFSTFTEYQGRDFFMSGESYGGRYLPIFAAAVVDGNAHLIKKDIAPINLQGVLIGNGISDSFSMIDAHYTYQCVTLPGLDKPINNINNCVKMAKDIPYCNELLGKECLKRHDSRTCAAAMNYCESVVSESFFDLHLNPYDVSKSCSLKELANGLCYGEIMDTIGKYLNNPELRHILGVSKKVPDWKSCSEKVGKNFAEAGDEMDQTWLYVAALLERGVPVISYVGTLDWICNFIGNEAWTDALAWTGNQGYNAQNLREWKVDGKVAGSTKSYGGLTFATVLGAGHMVPFDQPEVALAMLNRYLFAGGEGL